MPTLRRLMRTSGFLPVRRVRYPSVL